MTDVVAENRPYEPSPRRVARARSAGRIALSTQLTGGGVALAACLALLVSGKAILGGLVLFVRGAVMASTRHTPPAAALGEAVRALTSASAAPLLATAGTAILIGAVQTRGLFSAGLVRPGAHRFSPRLRRLWPRGSVGAVGLNLAEAVFLVMVGAACLAGVLPALARATTVPGLIDALLVCLTHVGLGLAAAMVALGLGDSFWRHHRHRQALRMTRDEAAREHKESEGDPLLKAEQKGVHREWLGANEVDAQAGSSGAEVGRAR